MVTERANWPTLHSELQQAWQILAGKYCTDVALIGHYFAEIAKQYASRNRYYHNLQHIAALWQLSNSYAGALINKEVVDFAIFYHDIIYNVLRKDNEARSARLAVKRLQALGVPPDAIQQVKLYIEATQSHTITSEVIHIHDLQLFLDFDMQILGTPWEQYQAYTQQVRREYRIYPDKLYYPGRNKFLEHCLGTDFIFQTGTFRERYEAVARENIRKELEVGSQR